MKEYDFQLCFYATGIFDETEHVEAIVETIARLGRELNKCGKESKQPNAGAKIPCCLEKAENTTFDYKLASHSDREDHSQVRKGTMGTKNKASGCLHESL